MADARRRPALPPGYALTPYTPGDERHWAAIHAHAESDGAGAADREATQTVGRELAPHLRPPLAPDELP